MSRALWIAGLALGAAGVVGAAVVLTGKKSTTTPAGTPTPPAGQPTPSAQGCVGTTLSDGTMAAVTLASSGTTAQTFCAPVGGNIGTVDASSLGANASASASADTPSVTLTLGANPASTSGQLVVTWTDASGGSHTSTIPVVVTGGTA